MTPRCGVQPVRTRRRSVATLAAALAGMMAMPLSLGSQSGTTLDQYLRPGMPIEVVSAKKADRIAWIATERGLRNVYTATAPGFVATPITRFAKDDGVPVAQLSISDDGSIVTFVRGSDPNNRGWIANANSDPRGAERAIWVARTNGAGAWRVVEGTSPDLSPDGQSILFVRDGQIYRVPITRTGTTSAQDATLLPLIKAWGTNSNPVWSPDGSKIAFVSNRDFHAYIGIYDVAARELRYAAPGVDFDASPSWSRDSKQIAFTRRPGTPFGLQTDVAAGIPGVAAGRGGRGGRGAADDRPDPLGLYRPAFRGGHDIEFVVYDVASDSARVVWQNGQNDRTFTNISAITWAGDNLVFQQEPEQWTRYYSVSASGGTSTPIELTPGEGQLETLGISADGKTLFYGSNVGDIDRRHVWKVPTAGGKAERITTGDGIELSPAPLASGRYVAMLSSSATRPLGIGIVPTTGGAPKVIYPTLRADFPTSAHVQPQAVTLKAADGLEFYNQVFVPKNIPAGEKRPAVVFVHGGPPRQMLLGYHYMDFYHISYAVNQWLANQGYVVISVNYRLGIGYGKAFRQAANSGANGNAEYQDVVAAGRYLQSRPDVDPARIGIWGLSYGGLLAAQALARNSDLFVAGVDMAGVHLRNPSSIDTASIGYRSSVSSAIEGWKSPVFLWHGDDDRNVAFAQTIGLVNQLRKRNVYFELMVYPDEVHDTQIYGRWLQTFDRMDAFLRRFVWNKEKPPTLTGESK
jgi:dipeptidyl-peptidase 4